MKEETKELNITLGQYKVHLPDLPKIEGRCELMNNQQWRESLAQAAPHLQGMIRTVIVETAAALTAEEGKAIGADEDIIKRIALDRAQMMSLGADIATYYVNVAVKAK